jgi:ribose transport system permease protein
MTVATAAQPQRRSRWRHFLTQNVPLLLAIFILLAMVVYYAAQFEREQHHFPGNFEITSVSNNSLPLAVAAVGQTIVILTRGIDLSVGGMVDISNSVAAVHMHDSLGSMVLWSVIVLLVGAAGGMLNGLLVAFGRLQPILVTLATLSIFQGIAIEVLPQPGGAIPPGYTAALTNINQPYSLLYVVGMIALWLTFRRMPFGVAIFSIGNDEGAARANGINVTWTKVGAYTLSGLLAAAAGLFFAATTTGGDATAGNPFTLTSIAAVVLGGVSLFGGRGSAIGSIAGAFVLTILVNVLFVSNINQLYQEFYQGLFLVLAVVVSVLIGRYLRRVR